MLTLSFNHEQRVHGILSDLETSTKELHHLDKIGWAVYGSLATDTMTKDSDLDLLYIHNNKDKKPERVQAYHEGQPSTIYTISLHDLCRDGAEGYYGGYFTGKMMNPHTVITDKPNMKLLIQKVTADFIFPLALNARNENSADLTTTTQGIASDAILGFLDYCPWYENYFVRLFENDNFSKIWSDIGKHLSDGFELAGKISKNSDGTVSYSQDDARTLDYNRVNRIKLLRNGRFWSLGSVFHKANPHFIDYYIDHAKKEQRPDAINQMYSFLKNQQRSLPVTAPSQTLRLQA